MFVIGSPPRGRRGGRPRNIALPVVRIVQVPAGIVLCVGSNDGLSASRERG